MFKIKTGGIIVVLLTGLSSDEDAEVSYIMLIG